MLFVSLLIVGLLMDLRLWLLGLQFDRHLDWLLDHVHLHGLLLDLHLGLQRLLIMLKL
jgi:hypothetical protein